MRMRNGPHRARYLNACSTVGDAVWEHYGTLRSYSLAGGRLSPGGDMSAYSVAPPPVGSAFYLCLRGVVSDLPVPSTTMLPLPFSTVPPGTKVNSFFCKLLLLSDKK